MRRTYVLLIGLAVLVATPAPALAWWDFLEQFSGPRGFHGWDLQLRLFCLVETTPAGATDKKVETRSAPPIGVILSLCKVNPEKGERQKMMFDLGARFLRSNRYKDDPSPDFANGQTIHFTTLEPAVMFPVVGAQDGWRLDYGFGAGVYWFSSQGFESFNGAFLEPIRFDLRVPINKGWIKAIVARAGLLHFPAGFDAHAWAGVPDRDGRLGAEWVPIYSVSVDLIPSTFAMAQKFGIR
jgi:hypothetical protein